MSVIMSIARATFVAMLIAGPTLAQAGEVLLTITGTRPSDGVEISSRYDLAALKALPKTSFSTSIMWTEGVQDFEGVLLKDILDANGVTSGVISARAINEYSVDIPVSDAVMDGPIIAYALNGAPMSLREKGPLWIVYPYDQNPDYRTEVVFSHSVWQLDRIVITP